MTDASNHHLAERLVAAETELQTCKEVLDTVLSQNETLLDQIRECEEHIRSLQEEVAALSRVRDDTLAQLASTEQTMKAVVLRLRRIEGARPAAPRPPQSGPLPKPVAAPQAPAQAAPAPAIGSVPGPTPPPRAQDPDGSPGKQTTVIHLEHQAVLQRAVEATAAKLGATYRRADNGSEPIVGKRILAVNFLNPNADALSLVTAAARWGVDPPVAFAYCAEGDRGISFGLLDFFTPPLDVAAWTARILARKPSPQRCLVVSDNVEAANLLRESLTTGGCGNTSTAFDARQALDLAPMTRPDLALIDLGSPKGNGLQVACRVRAVAHQPHMRLAFFWLSPIPAEPFRQHAQRTIRDLPFTPDHLARAIHRYLGPPTPGAPSD